MENEEKQVGKKKLSPLATILLTVGGTALTVAIIGIIGIIFAKLG